MTTPVVWSGGIRFSAVMLGVPQAAVAESSAKGMTVPASSGWPRDPQTIPPRTCRSRVSMNRTLSRTMAKYIYVITGQTLAIVDAYPATSASVISRTEIGDTPRDIFIDGNRLVLFVTGTADTDTTSTPSGASPGHC